MVGRILVLGATSLVGSHFASAASSTRELVTIGRTDPKAAGLPESEFHLVQIGDEGALRTALRRVRCDVWVNFAARTDVDTCEMERTASGQAESRVSSDGSAMRLNSDVPLWLAQEARDLDAYLVQLSTDFVFDGEDGPYPESSTPSRLSERLSWYGYTKGLGERAVLSTCPKSSVLRISYPYRSAYHRKEDFARAIIRRARAGQLYPMYTDQVITPTWIPDVTHAVDALIAAMPRGTFHVASPETTTPFEFASTLIAALDEGLKGPRADLASRAVAEPRRAPRPLRGGLKVGRVRELGLEPLSFREGVREMALSLRR